MVLIASCATTIEIGENLTAEELVQRGQEAMDSNRYRTALQFYQALYDRNPGHIDRIITAEYHIAFIHYKQRNYTLARTGFNSVIEHYNIPDEELLPQHFRRLAQIVLQRIDEIEGVRPAAEANR
jgi:outer membrane protein assembly factor BamD (BamD/ComL family)